MDGRFEILEELAMMLGFEEVDLVEALAEAKVLHDVTEHGLILYKKARGAVARAPTPSASPRSSATGYSAPLTARATVWPRADPGGPQWPVWRRGYSGRSAHERGRGRQRAVWMVLHQH